jgi:hypothetical protein
VSRFQVRAAGVPIIETLIMSLVCARAAIAAWIGDCNRERPHSAPGHDTAAAFAAELNKQWPASLAPKGSALEPIASTAPRRNPGTGGLTQ